MRIERGNGTSPETLGLSLPLQGGLERCIQCGICLAVCPTYVVTLEEGMAPRGRMALVRGAQRGKVALGSPGFAHRVTSCIGCLACDVTCPVEVPVSEILHQVRIPLCRSRWSGFWIRWVTPLLLWRWPLRWGLALLAPLFRLYRRIPLRGPLRRWMPFVWRGVRRRWPDPRGRSLMSRHPRRIPTSWKQPRGVVAFFPGCVIIHASQSMGEATIRVLNKLGFDVLLPPEQVCCGIPLRILGDEEGLRRLARRNLEVFQDLEVTAVITTCASCGMTLKRDYPRLFVGEDGWASRMAALARRVQDIHEFLVRYWDFQPDRPLPEPWRGLRVTFHDPCHLKRGQGIVQAPRDLLRHLPGVDYVEMEEADRCCGFGGTFSVFHYPTSAAIGDRKVLSIQRSGARTVATGCPGCQIHLSDALHRAGTEVPVVHTVELLDQVMEASALEARYWATDAALRRQTGQEDQAPAPFENTSLPAVEVEGERD